MQQPLSHVTTAFILLGLLVATMISPAAQAQTQTAPQSHRIGPGGVVPGDKCKRRTDDIEGVVKIDACGRWYCGRIDVNDITVLNPRFAETMGCRWQLVESKCKCVRPR